MFIKIKDVYYSYPNDSDRYVLDNISLEIKKGELLSLIGPNGSGKSTFAKLLNVLILPVKGEVFIDGINTKDKDNIWDIRKKIGMVFQNPDNQIVASIVENDVAFGPENLGLLPSEINKRVNKSLEIVGLAEFRKSEPHYLSGGQKQRLAIAGVLAMEPECIVMDEPTSMLDPEGKKEVLNIIDRLNKDLGITIILITQDMDEILQTERTIALNQGKIYLEGSSRSIFEDFNKLEKISLGLTKIGELVYELSKEGISFPSYILGEDDLVNYLCKLN